MNKLTSLPAGVFDPLSNMIVLYVQSCAVQLLWPTMTPLTPHTHVCTHAYMLRNLADNQLAGLPYNMFASQPSSCVIMLSYNPCAQQPCGAGLQWFSGNQTQFCASGVPPTKPQTPGGPTPNGFPWLVLGAAGVVTALCMAVGVLMWCHRRHASKARTQGQQLYHDQEMAATVPAQYRTIEQQRQPVPRQN